MGGFFFYVGTSSIDIYGFWSIDQKSKLFGISSIKK